MKRILYPSLFILHPSSFREKLLPVHREGHPVPASRVETNLGTNKVIIETGKLAKYILRAEYLAAPSRGLLNGGTAPGP